MTATLYGFSETQELVTYDSLPGLMKSKMVDDFLINELRSCGLGDDLYKEQLELGGKVSYKNFLNWLYIEQAGMGIINGLCNDFETVEILEHYNDYYKMRVPRGEKSIGFVFGMIESKKEEFKISEYSVSQTTLEQIFQTFANIKLDDDTPKLLFNKKAGSNRAELYSEKGEGSFRR